MDEPNQAVPQPASPPKRKSAIGESARLELARQQEEAEQSKIFEEIDPELLAEFEKAVKEVGNEAIVDFSVPPKESAIAAPILEDYIDPHAVPISYLLELARAPVKASLIPLLTENEWNENDETEEQSKDE